MFKKNPQVYIVLILLLVFISAMVIGCAPRNDINRQINVIVKDYVFSIAGWEFKTLSHEIKPSGISTVTEDDIAAVRQYFDISAQINTLKAKTNAGLALNSPGLTPAEAANEGGLLAKKNALKPRVEAVIERQIRDTLTELGIYNPFCGKGSFPPVNFKLSTPPDLLIISPREKIERIRDVMLVPDISIDDIESVEDRVAALGVSALIEPLGGLGATFPTFVQDDADLKFTIKAAVEEWLHQYLTFQPLGINYVMHSLGIKTNYDIVTIDETIASLASEEIGDMVYEKYYGKVEIVIPSGNAKPSFDFNAAMREIRINTDTMLAAGQITEAEQYMEAQRQILAEHGYYIRKLNQAYFAFYGSYADAPTSVDPIGTKIREIRAKSASVGDFLKLVAGVTSESELDKILTNNQ